MCVCLVLVLREFSRDINKKLLFITSNSLETIDLQVGPWGSLQRTSSTHNLDQPMDHQPTPPVVGVGVWDGVGVGLGVGDGDGDGDGEVGVVV